MNRKEHWRFNRKSLQETIVVVVVGTLAIGVFLGVVRVMDPGNSSQGESSPQAAETVPSAVNAPDAYDEAGDAPDESQPPPPG